jgi:hypothetical protein
MAFSTSLFTSFLDSGCLAWRHFWPFKGSPSWKTLDHRDVSLTSAIKHSTIVSFPLRESIKQITHEMTSNKFKMLCNFRRTRLHELCPSE